jgi:hypothetical protein
MDRVKLLQHVKYIVDKQIMSLPDSRGAPRAAFSAFSLAPFRETMNAVPRIAAG